MKKNRIFRLGASVIITAVFLYLIFSNTDPEKLALVFSNADLKLLILGFFCYMLVLVFRAIRFRILLKNSISLKHMIPVVFKYNLFNYILPFKLGELSYVYLLKKKKKPLKEGLSTLIIARLFDLIAIVFVFLAGILLIGNLPEMFSLIFPFAVLLIFLLIGFVFLLLFFPKVFVSIVNRIFYFLKKTKIRLLDSINEKINEFLHSFKRFNHITISKTFFMSVVIFFTGFFTTLLILQSLNIYIRLSYLLVLIPLGVLSGLIPVQGIAGFGTFESLWIVGFVAYGFSISEAAIISLGIHIVQLIYTLILGSMGFLAERIQF